ncbi:ATP-binding cassette domain-containing protein [Candidatus Shapirobacteria bacterium]|nr:ATP-binding cassette domain-containing protein [Candidatus Shapirobacteria bacterium]
MKIIFDHVTKSYGVVTALRDSSLTIEPGEFVFIVGPSGAGKSTVIKLLLHQIKPTSGDIIINDCHINTATKPQIDILRRQIGVVFQDYQLIPDKNIEENISIALDIVGYPSQNISAKIDQVINQVGLQTRRHQFPSQLSGGELQRAALARALAVEPKIILADEPTGNLDNQNSWNLIKLFKDINEQSGTTIIMTTHNLDIVQSLSKRVISIDNGQIIDSQSTPTSTPIINKKKKLKTKKKIL